MVRASAVRSAPSAGHMQNQTPTGTRQARTETPREAPLRRAMGLVHATAMVVGIILGASIFVQPSEITRLVPNPRGLLLVWLGAGLLTFCGALVCAELTNGFPRAGG